MMRHDKMQTRRKYLQSISDKISLSRMLKISLAIKEMQIKTKWDITTHVSGWQKLEIMTIANTDKNAGTLECSHTAGEM